MIIIFYLYNSGISALLPFRSLGYMIGSMIAGVLGDRGMDHQILLMVALFFAIGQYYRFLF